MKGKELRWETERLIIGTAREALEKEPLELYPSILTIDPALIPEASRPIKVKLEKEV